MSELGRPSFCGVRTGTSQFWRTPTGTSQSELGRPSQNWDVLVRTGTSQFWRTPTGTSQLELGRPSSDRDQLGRPSSDMPLNATFRQDLQWHPFALPRWPTETENECSTKRCIGSSSQKYNWDVPVRLNTTGTSQLELGRPSLVS